MTPRQLEILQHALGCDQYGQSAHRRGVAAHRDYFPYNRDYYIGEDVAADDLASAGLMVKLKGNVATGGEPCYRVTPAGIKAMRTESPAPTKLTRSQLRYQEFLNVSDAWGYSFREFLRIQKEPWYQEMKARG